MFSRSKRKRFHLSAIEKVVDITSKDNQSAGTFCFSKFEESFEIHWAPMDGTPIQEVNAVLQSIDPPSSNEWKPREPFLVECSRISLLHFNQNPLSIVLLRADQTGERVFMIPNNDYKAIAQFIEQLFINGVAVPSPQHEYGLTFYGRSHKGFYAIIPPYIHFNASNYSDLSSFWFDTVSFYIELIKYLDTTNTLPKDPAFPLGASATAGNMKVMRKILNNSASFAQYTKITKKEWKSLFDVKGKLKEANTFRKRLFNAGCEPEILSKTVPFAVGIYPLSSSKQKRSKINKLMTKEFSKLTKQLKALTPQQLNSNQKLSGFFQIIDKDVNRTDRGLTAFQKENGTGLKILRQLLQVFVIYCPQVGYLQGMNDLFVPFILAYFPKWTEDGNPIDRKGKHINVDHYLPRIFFSFDNFLRNTHQLQLFLKRDLQINNQAMLVSKIIEENSPLASIWLRRHGLNDLMWCQSDIFLLFKRTYQDIWPIWFRFNLSTYPDKWLTYFLSAIILLLFDKIAVLPDANLTSMMEAYPKMIRTIDIPTLGRVALWLSDFTQFKIDRDCLTIDTSIGINFFENDWISRSKSE